MEHPLPVTVKVTDPPPDPPDVVRLITVPTGTVVVVFDTVRVFWARESAAGVTAADVADWLEETLPFAVVPDAPAPFAPVVPDAPVPFAPGVRVVAVAVGVASARAAAASAAFFVLA